MTDPQRRTDARIDCQQTLIDQLAREVQALRAQQDHARAALAQLEEERRVLSAFCGKLLLVQAVAWREGRVYANN